MDIERLNHLADMYKEKLDGADHERGQLEELEATCNNLRTAVGFLIALLIVKSVLTLDDISRLEYVIDTNYGGRYK